MFQSCSSLLTAQTDGWWTLGFMGGGWRAEERNKIVQGIKREREREHQTGGNKRVPEVRIKDGKKCEWESYSHTKEWLIKRK